MNHKNLISDNIVLQTVQPYTVDSIITQEKNKMPSTIRVGIIGGTGLDQDSSLLKEKKFVDLKETP